MRSTRHLRSWSDRQSLAVPNTDCAARRNGYCGVLGRRREARADRCRQGACSVVESLSQPLRPRRYRWAPIRAKDQDSELRTKIESRHQDKDRWVHEHYWPGGGRSPPHCDEGRAHHDQQDHDNRKSCHRSTRFGIARYHRRRSDADLPLAVSNSFIRWSAKCINSE